MEAGSEQSRNRVEERMKTDSGDDRGTSVRDRVVPPPPPRDCR